MILTLYKLKMHFESEFYSVYTEECSIVLNEKLSEEIEPRTNLQTMSSHE